MEAIQAIIDMISRDYPILLPLILVLYYFWKKVEKLDGELKEERRECSEKLTKLNTDLREADRENIKILNDMTSLMSNITDLSEEQLKYLRNIRTMIKNKLE